MPLAHWACPKQKILSLCLMPHPGINCLKDKSEHTRAQELEGHGIICGSMYVLNDSPSLKTSFSRGRGVMLQTVERDSLLILYNSNIYYAHTSDVQFMIVALIIMMSSMIK